MTRSVPEWIGKTSNTDVPPRVRARVFLAKGGRCHRCTRKVNASIEPWTCEHLIALVNDGENRESNLGVTCENCLPAKNAEDVAEKSKVARKRVKDMGLKPPPRQAIKSRGFAKSSPRNRASASVEKLASLPRPQLYGE
jgi:5-methylcytosine-specific restriction enzyme A